MSALICLKRRLTASFTRVLVVLTFLWALLGPDNVQAEVNVELSITDRSGPARPRGSSVTPFELDEGGKCARAFKVIGEITIKFKAPAAGKLFAEKLDELEPELVRVGADGIIITSFIIHELTEAGSVESGTTRAAIIRFTDLPRVDKRTEADFKAVFRSKSKLSPLEGIWVDQSTKERVAFFEDPAQKGHFLGVQFDVADETDVPVGLVVADLRLHEGGWLTGHVIFDDFTRYEVKMRLPAGDEFEIPIKKCTNAFVARAYPDKFPPEYELVKVKYLRQAAK